MTKSDCQVLDLFCGPGGLGTGFEQYFDVVEAVDINPDACETYSLNHAQTCVRNLDIREMSFSRNDYGGVIVRGLVGGSPCQDFTELNARRNPDSARANLVYEMARAIREIRPDFALIENVARIPLRHKQALEREIAGMGYNMVQRTIRACDYGSVQIRRRWILTACRTKHIFPDPHPPQRVARDILTGEESEIEARPKTLQAIQDLPAGRWVALPGQSYKVYFVVDPEALLPAIVNPTKLRYVRPDRTGYLSLSELYRAQGFPAGYKFAGCLSSIGQQLADAVPVELAAAFAGAFYEHYA